MSNDDSAFRMMGYKRNVENPILETGGTYRLTPEAAVWVEVDDWTLAIYRQPDGRIGIGLHQGQPDGLTKAPVDWVIFPRQELESDDLARERREQTDRIERLAWDIAKFPDQKPPMTLEEACALVRERHPNLDDVDAAETSYCLYMAHGLTKR